MLSVLLVIMMSRQHVYPGERGVRSPGRFGPFQLVGFLALAAVIGAPLVRHVGEHSRLVTGLAVGAQRTALPPSSPASPDLGARPGPPSVGEWADRVGVPVAAATLSARVSSPFGLRRHPVWGDTRHHAGVDFAARRGSPVLATASGVVTAAGSVRGYGLRVEVDHPVSGLTTLYAHLDRLAPGIRTGSRVRRGALVGYVGTSGLVTGAHLHYEVVGRDGRALDPAELSRRYRASYDRAVSVYRNGTPVTARTVERGTPR